MNTSFVATMELKVQRSYSVQNYYNEASTSGCDRYGQSRSIREYLSCTGKWAGVFQFTEQGAQKFCVRAKPRNIIDVSAITSIYRPGPLSANVHDEYVEAKENPHHIEYLNGDCHEITQETFGFLIFQEQIALLAHKLGGLTLDEGNICFAKVFTKKGTGKGSIKGQASR